MRKRIIVVFLIILIIPAIFLQNRIRFGVWNPFELPDRIECYGRRYYNHAKGDIALEDGEIYYEISFSDCKTLKELYSTSRIDDCAPTVIYLKTGENSYHVYTLSGGP